MNEIIDYGGEDYTRAEVIRDMQRMGESQAAIDRWFQGYELAKELAKERLVPHKVAEDD
jgi:hypothetical protein